MISRFLTSAKVLLEKLAVFRSLFLEFKDIDSFSLSQIASSVAGSSREPASPYEKLNLLRSFSSVDHYWVETGTYMGYTTRGLSAISNFVHTLEPSKYWYEKSLVTLSDLANVKIHNASSEEKLSEILATLPPDVKVNLWLDGHFSGGETFLGERSSPIEIELEQIRSSPNLSNFSIFVDDFRCFGIEEGYPQKDFLVGWSRAHGFEWTVERDIFIMHFGVK